ncbi:sensor histidine kinase [Methylocystis heyeri]|uniref:Sensor histidine kinase n=1 Tax=Methylocystis heyeri TaxID=391905 RepID=A0A6B8KFL6_9HYPH|nr:histidine kinase [Methylocystis heyeri]QGM46517.1 sensor histidine kinase [Methylocystis heyeri]
MGLIVRLVMQLCAIAVFCLALTTGWIMIDAHSSLETETAASADRVSHELETLFWRELLWRHSMRRDKILPIPNWESLATLKLVSPGVCIVFAPAAEEPRTLCSQLEGVGSQAPSWFSGVYGGIFGRPAPVARPLTVRQPETGAVVATADADAAIRQAWRQISVVFRVAATMAIGICLLSALAVAHALAPAQTIIDGLRSLESGNYRRRIAVATGEFGMIGRAMNDLAARLAQTSAERVALTKRLFEVQEEERRAVARDLHDEFGQCLAATAAFAAAIEAGAGDRPDLAEDARAILRVAKRMTATLREALARLRSQELEELGLEPCLIRLVAGWNAQSAPKAVVRLDLMGDLAAVPPAVAASVYRIAQECLTNAMRHGAPREVHLRVERAASANGVIALTVEDDGGGDPAAVNASPGHGILGVTERVAAFGGSLSITRAAEGVRVAARIPLIAMSASAPLEFALA